MTTPIAAIDSVVSSRPITPVSTPPLNAAATASPAPADPAAVLAFHHGASVTAAPPALASARPFGSSTSPGAAPQPIDSSSFMRWAEQAQQEFAASLAQSPSPHQDFSSMVHDVKRVAMSCMSVSLCKNVADQLIQAGQTLLRQQN